ncbi:fimbrial protein [Stenotrophomonas maltophilia]|nr:fimbrial protein [Stenotrophomonas maltophilia]
MRCPGAGISVGLALADAHDPGNTGSVLSPTADSDAGGVRIELLNGGAPVRLGQRWEHGVSAGANETLFFGARYRRTADDLVPGDIKGEAILSADYR